MGIWVVAWIVGNLAIPQSGIIRGVVTDDKTAAPIVDARVALVEAERFVNTSTEGRFQFENVIPGRYTITVSTIGYIYVHRTIDVIADATVDVSIPLAEGTGTYRETVTVNAPTASSTIGVPLQNELGSAALQELRGVATDDPARAMQALPGVATGNDFQALFSVRGSAFRHVGVVTDGTATPLLVHTVQGVQDSGSIAMINSDVLDHAALVAGAQPQRDGDWLGATLEFEIREGSRDRTQARVAVSGTNASSVLEGPIGPSKRGSWLVSLRKSYADWLIRKLEPSLGSTIGFSDVQSKVGYDLTPRQHVQALFIGGRAIYQAQQASFANGLLWAMSKSGLVSGSWRYTGDSMVITQRVSVSTTRFSDRGVIGQELGGGNARSILWRGDVSAMLGGGWTVEGGAKTDRQQDARAARVFLDLDNGQVAVRLQQDTAASTTIFGGWGQLSYAR